MAFVQGFGGMRVRNGKLLFNPFIPKGWSAYTFRINYRGAHLELSMDTEQFKVINHSRHSVPLTIAGKDYELPSKGQLAVDNQITIKKKTNKTTNQ